VMFRCCFCGRKVSSPKVFIGVFAVGSTCAKRAGLLDRARKKTGVLRLAKPNIGARRADPQTLDLFAEVEHA